MRAWFGLLPTVDMDSGFIFTVFLTSGPLWKQVLCSSVFGQERDFCFFSSSNVWHGEKCKLVPGAQISPGSIYPGDTFIKVGK